MTIPQYTRWTKEIVEQKDLIISTQQYVRLCNVFIQDVWLDITQPGLIDEITTKSKIMFDLQGHFVK